MTERHPLRPVVLCVLDGWGHRDDAEDNAVSRAETPNWDRFMATAPHALLDASEHEVGLPAGQMGNSEVGHMTLGAGRIVLQDLPRIDAALADGSLAANPVLTRFIARLQASGGTAHLMGLMSPGGVHSHQDHIAALARILSAAGLPVAVHAFLDGRDTPPASAAAYLAHFEATAGLACATVSGRYYAMDRDQRWDRVALAYDALVSGQGARADDAQAAIAASHDAGITDEFVRPTVLGDPTMPGHYAGMADGDGLLMVNFRSDRARQILAALLDSDFDGFHRRRRVRFAAALGMVRYAATLDPFLDALFPPRRLANVLGAVVAEAGKTQLRIAETEKYAHVTFFLNGGEEKVFPGEDRILLPSPKVATYDLAPEMAAREVTDRLVAAVASDRYDLIVVNYANTDMVGHTGDFAATVRAIATVDSCLGRLAAAVTAAGGALVITADHGNAEQMRDDASGHPHTAHTRNRVPVVLIGAPDGATVRNGRLADIAPTLLTLMGLAPPAEMTGVSLLTPAVSDPRHPHEKETRRRVPV